MAEPDGGGGRAVMKRTRIDIINILKYGMLLVIIVYIAVLLAAQGGDAPAETVKGNVLSAADTEGMQEADAQDFKRYYGLNANDYEEVILFLPKDVMAMCFIAQASLVN